MNYEIEFKMILSKETMLSDTREFRRLIRETVIKFDEEDWYAEEMEVLECNQE